MRLERKIEARLLEYYDNNPGKILLIDGARQVIHHQGYCQEALQEEDGECGKAGHKAPHFSSLPLVKNEVDKLNAFW